MTIDGYANTMQAIPATPRSRQQQNVYRVAGESIVVEARDSWAEDAIAKLFAGWYLTPETKTGTEQTAHDIVIQSTATPPQVPRDWQQFEIAGSGVCYTDGSTSYIDIEGSVVAINAPGSAAVEIWANGPLDLQSPALTRIVTYALAAVLRRRGVFELHSAALVEPRSDRGVLIVGPSGSGKSTLTVQLATAGWPFLTDDVLALTTSGGEISAWPLRRCFAITPETLASSNFLQSCTSLDHRKPQKDEKKQFTPHDVFAGAFREHCMPRVLFFSQVSGDEQSRVCKLSPGEAMARLIRMNPWSCYDQATAADHLAVLSALVKQSRGYSLFAGTDLLDPDCAVRLIETHTKD
ncbi:MAG: hypothetical protein ABJC10_05475 [Acidobacteriota bacterium]